MQAHLITRIEDIPLSEAEWNRLVFNNPTNTVFQTYQWFHSWWECHGADYRLFFVYVEDGGDIVGFAPFMLSNSKGGRTLCFSADSNSDYNDIISPTNRKQSIDAIFSLILLQAQRISIFRLINIPDSSDSTELIHAFFHAHGIRNIHITSTPTPTLLMEGHDPSPRDILKKYSVRRPLNYFSRAGNIQYRKIDDADEGIGLLDKFFEQHINRCSLAPYRSLFENKKNRDFYKSLLLRLLPLGWVFFSVLELNGEPIAFHYGFDYESKIIWYKPSFDILYQNHSPGTLLMRFLILHTLDNGRNELDMTIGNEPFKSRFSNYTRNNNNIFIYKSRLDYMLYVIKRGLYALCKTLTRTLSPAKHRKTPTNFE